MMKICIVTYFSITFSFVFSGLYSQKQNIRYNTVDDIIYGICFSPDGHSLAIADQNNVKLFSTRSQQLIKEFKGGHSSQIMAIDISKDSTWLISGGKDSTIVIWNYRSTSIVNSLRYHNGVVTSLAISADNRYLVSGSTDHKVYLYDLAEGKVVHEYTAHSNVVTTVKFSPTDALFASAGGDRLIHLYSPVGKNPIFTLRGHKSWVREISFNSTGTSLISGGDDTRVKIWNISNPLQSKLLTSKKMGDGWVLTANYGDENSTYAIATTNGYVSIRIGAFGTYRTRIGRSANKILLQPGRGEFLTVALATRGGGVIQIDAAQMKLKRK